MPKIVRFHQTGGPEVLQFEEEPQRQPSEGEVRLRVQAIGLNRAESLYYHGHYFEQPQLPSRLGYEAVGIVDAVGPDGDKSLVGQRMGMVPGYSQNQYGVLGEEAIVPESSLARLPDALTAEQGAAVWMQYTTAYGALVDIGKVQADDFVVITAASSSVGLAAIQIVQGEGATAIATTRTGAKRQELLDLGADHVIATEEEDLPERVQEITAGKGARIVFDAIAGPFLEKLAGAAAKGGIIVEYGALSMQPTPFPLRPAMSKGLSIRGYTLHEISQDPQRLERARQYVYDRLADGRFVPKIAKVFPFTEAMEAYRYLESNQQVGKVVISVSQ